jgi:ABC-type antimicrobial peptide transport system permease subunit
MTEGFWGNKIEAVRAATFVVRSERAGTEAFLAELRAAVSEVSGSVPIGQVRTVADFYSRSMAVTSFALVMLAIAAAMALVLGVVGIYGVMAYAVAQRTREIAIRLALGARPGSVRGLFVRDGLRLASIGVACGLIAAIASTRLMSSLLFGVSALDPATYVAGALIVISAAAAASFLPALRATRGPIAGRLRAE